MVATEGEILDFSTLKALKMHSPDLYVLKISLKIL